MYQKIGWGESGPILILRGVKRTYLTQELQGERTWKPNVQNNGPSRQASPTTVGCVVLGSLYQTV